MTTTHCGSNNIVGIHEKEGERLIENVVHFIQTDVFHTLIYLMRYILES